MKSVLALLWYSSTVYLLLDGWLSLPAWMMSRNSAVIQSAVASSASWSVAASSIASDNVLCWRRRISSTSWGWMRCKRRAVASQFTSAFMVSDTFLLVASPEIKSRTYDNAATLSERKIISPRLRWINKSDYGCRTTIRLSGCQTCIGRTTQFPIDRCGNKNWFPHQPGPFPARWASRTRSNYEHPPERTPLEA